LVNSQTENAELQIKIKALQLENLKLQEEKSTWEKTSREAEGRLEELEDLYKNEAQKHEETRRELDVFLLTKMVRPMMLFWSYDHCTQFSEKLQKTLFGLPPKRFVAFVNFFELFGLSKKWAPQRKLNWRTAIVAATIKIKVDRLKWTCKTIF
jgi:hypothetical protein